MNDVINSFKAVYLFSEVFQNTQLPSGASWNRKVLLVLRSAATWWLMWRWECSHCLFLKPFPYPPNTNNDNNSNDNNNNNNNKKNSDDDDDNIDNNDSNNKKKRQI